MPYPLAPTVFEAQDYQPAWFDRDEFWTPLGVVRTTDHHCKLAFNISLPFAFGFRNALDIGCRDGEFARYLTHYFEHTYAFDPRLRYGFAHNTPPGKATHFTCALGDEERTIVMYGGTHDNTRVDPAEHACFKLDNFGFTDVDYIKIDVEGFEKKVLAGGQRLIDRCRPLILIEQNEVLMPGETPFSAKAWLERKGYRHVATCHRGWDHVMMPEERIVG